MLAAWRALPSETGSRNYSTEIATQIQAQVRAKAGKQKAREIRALFNERSLNF
jgi:hypothetical protein